MAGLALTALSVVGNGTWLGNDGPWSTFSIGFGTPVQVVQSLISSSTSQSYVVIPEGCTAFDLAGCESARGGFFLANESSTWQDSAKNSTGDFGRDDIFLDSEAIVMEDQTMAGVVSKDHFLASFGLQSLKATSSLASLSWGYTAGSYQLWQDNSFANGSLTLGGYDATRFNDSGVSFSMGQNPSRDLVLDLISIDVADLVTEVPGKSNSMLSDPIPISLDSGVSHIWLPVEACQRFESEFNLNYNPELDLYLVDDTVHEALLSQNATVIFTLGNSTSSSTSDQVVINVPYSSFDLQLTAEYPGKTVNQTGYYFPIRRATNASQYTLGRAFFQSAYVIANYEQSTFSVNQALFPADNASELVVILPSGASSEGDGISMWTIIGIALGIGGGILILATCSALRTSSSAEVEEAESTGSGLQRKNQAISWLRNIFRFRNSSTQRHKRSAPSNAEWWRGWDSSDDESNT